MVRVLFVCLGNICRSPGLLSVAWPSLEYAPPLGRREVPDPYFAGDFSETHALVDAAADGLLAAIRAAQGV